MNAHVAELRNRIYGLWLDKINTADMAKALQLRECDIERQLHNAMAMRRAVIENLGTKAVEERTSAVTPQQEQRGSPS